MNDYTIDDIVLIKVGKNQDKIGQNYYVAFDPQGKMVNVRFKNNKILNHASSFDEDKLKKLGFHIKNNEVPYYLEEKGYKKNRSCNCLIDIDTDEKKDCTPRDCISSKRTIQINKNYS